MMSLAIQQVGMVTAVGLSAPASCAAMRAALDGFLETRFVFGETPIMGAPVPLAEPWTGRDKLLHMAASAIQECLAGLGPDAIKWIPLLLCLPEETRPGRLDELNAAFLGELEGLMNVKFSEHSAVFTDGRLGGVKALARANQLIDAKAATCIVAGADTFLLAETLEEFNNMQRLLTEENSNGFIPGEAAAAVMVGKPEAQPRSLVCTGLGFGTEPATILSEEPLRADGLKQAMHNALQDASASWADIDYRISDANGEQYWFREAALALTRSMRVRKAEMDLWHPADCIGEVGAAIVPCVLGVGYFAERKAYRPGPGVLCHFSADGDERAALVLRGQSTRVPSTKA